MIKFNAIIAILILMSCSGFVFGMDYGDIRMSEIYYIKKTVEKPEHFNHKPFSDENKKESVLVHDHKSTYPLKVKSNNDFQNLRSKR